MMSFDDVFNHALATADLTSIMKVLENDSKVDTQSESFRLVLELSIQNGEEAVFARLLRYILKKGSKWGVRAMVSSRA